MSESKKRVLVVDDSVFARKIVTDIISSSSELEVAGTATNGREALELIRALQPDVITMDVEMPEMNGIDTLRALMNECPTPVVMLSSLTSRGARESITALALGAVDIMAKPNGTHAIGLSMQATELVAKVKAATGVDVKRLTPPQATIKQPRLQMNREKTSAFPVVMIASSTGGPRAVRTVLPSLTDARAAYMIIQHIPESFSRPFAEDLDNMTFLSVKEAAEGDMLQPGQVLIAKAGYHNVFNRTNKISLELTPPLWGVRPSADVTMISAIEVFGSRLIGVVLTGMGRDGANGTSLIKQAGGITIAEHESSCVVYGMPRVAAETGMVDTVTPIQQMAEAINTAVSNTILKNITKGLP